MHGERSLRGPLGCDPQSALQLVHCGSGLTAGVLEEGHWFEELKRLVPVP